MLHTDTAALLLIDIQGKLAEIMYEKELLFKNVQNLIKGFQVLDMPILWVEQNPQRLGPTVPEITELLTDLQPISKMSFSSCRELAFRQQLQELNRHQILLAGIETHVCVYQSAVDLLELGHEVHVVTDAVSSRTRVNKEIGLLRMRESGVFSTGVETALFELLQVAEGDAFREILRILK
ncbi:MAG: hydrolase [Desulfuromonadaceae bacterium]